MRTSTLALLSVVGTAAAQGVTAAIAPTGSAPASCKPTFASNFEISVVDVEGGSSSKRDLTKRTSACSSNGILVAALSDGILKDAKDRTGYIASNYQFQFDEPPQAGAIYTSGFSACDNGSLALGSSTVFYKCQSGDFFNLYDRNWADQCSPVEITILPCDTNPSDPSVQQPDGQVVGTEVITTTVVMPLSDGQPQVITTTMPIPLCQISDGQAQVHTTPCASVTTSAESATPTTAAPASQYSDGQIQITPAGGGGVVTTPSATGETTVTLPTETMPTATGSASVVPVASSNSTLETTATPTTLPNTPPTSAASSSPGASGTSAPASGAGRADFSLAALVVGVFAAVNGL